MHEMGIALETARLAGEEAKKAGAGRVLALSLKVGRWSGVEPETLRFALETVLGDSPATKGCRVEIEVTEPELLCKNCGTRFPVEGWFDPCPRCGGPGVELAGGDELLLAGIEVEDA